jgi:hypothetical protein
MSVYHVKVKSVSDMPKTTPPTSIPEMRTFTPYSICGYYELRVDENELETEVMDYHGGTGRFAMRESILRIALMEFSRCENSHLSGGSRSFDHLQSSSVILDEGGDVISRTTYTAFGEVRGEVGASPTDYTITAQ